MSRRRVRPDELDLWRQVARTAEPLMRPPAKADLTDSFTPKAALSQPAPKKPLPLPAFKVGERAQTRDTLPGLTDYHTPAPPTMDRKAFGKLKRGKMKPEARIDLHGMTVDRAHNALNGFVMRAHGQGKRLILVITGKGKRTDGDGPIPVRQGVLRHNVPHWLSLPPLSQMVMQVSKAHGKHGGGGAYYVYLRRPR
ncbi:Smr/MutS family protein [Roseovarius sp. LXJ103]|uniref:Smr/MutS family protein n=1 Tax=Roseovarius carneus TaxID=2853164 RepID=UPI000D603E28|nr:Smr/MutS family protein [Roseovarius carneus]MBZ8117930.1 Smr/MutS family protein [Roseovarius carneus]PWE36316.1 DNA mismatch repair protein MutS [Pelagicola sp. LXJ1103]